MKVVVFQWPCGTAARQRSPLGARPRRRAILVVAPVSVDEDERVGIEVELAFEPGLARRLHVGALLLGGVRGLFLYVMPRRSKKRQIVVRPKRASRASISFVRRSSSVTSGAAATSARMKSACASMRCDRRSPPWRAGARLPDALRRHQRIAVVGADREAGRRLAPRKAAIDDGDDAFTKIERQRLAHACRPPRASTKLESGRSRFGNPTTSPADRKVL